MYGFFDQNQFYPYNGNNFSYNVQAVNHSGGSTFTIFNSGSISRNTANDYQKNAQSINNNNAGLYKIKVSTPGRIYGNSGITARGIIYKGNL
jgi:hypothetical protein